MNRWIAVIIMVLISWPVSARPLTVSVQDQNGAPLPDAVVEVRRERVGTAASENAVIDQVDRRFVPTVVAIHPGQRVEFPNSDNVRHHVYSFSPIRQFSTRLYANEPVDPIRFNEPGIATLGCNIHDSMIAYVYVSEWRHVAVSGADGRLALENLDAGALTLHVWHPRLTASDNRTVIELPASAIPGDDTPLNIELTVRPPEQDFGFGALTGEET